MIEEIRNIKSGKKQLKEFGLTVGVVLGLLGLLFLWRGKGFYLYFLSISVFLILSGLIKPMLLKPIQKVWMGFAVVMGWFMSRVILVVLFFLVVAPIGIVFKLLRKDLLGVKIDKEVESYWVEKEDTVQDKSNYERQF
ncbi:MAG: SxtJ family membrane protein [Candidatus Omnitrophota bacterium]